MDREKEKQTSVVFVAGAGWSGTTLLEQALAQADGYVSVGELYWLWKPFWPVMTCECGEQFERCPFWTAVVEEAYGAKSDAIRARVARLGRHFDQHVMLSALTGTAHLRPSRAFRDLARLVEPVYRAVLSVSGASVVIDASKYPMWGFTALAGENIDVSVVQLVRDPRAFLVSAARAHPLVYPPGEWEPGRTALRSVITWLLMSVEAEWLTDRAPQRALLLYRNLVADPIRTIDRVAQMTGVEAWPPSFEGNSLVVRKLGHAIGGHYSRPKLGSTELVFDDDRRVVNAPSSVRAAAGLAMPWWDRYQRNVARSGPHRPMARAGAAA